MEIELKYSLPGEETAEWLWQDEELGAMTEEGSMTVDHLYGSYYDTEGMLLAKNDITFRLRHEGQRVVACMKWSGQEEGALHKRNELNVTVGTEMPDEADPSVFGESEAGRILVDAIGDRKLIPIMEVDVLRKMMRVDTGSSLLELSIDRGRVITKNGDVPISEVEIELYQGNEDDLMELGKWLSEKYDLTAEPESKFAKGLQKLKEE